MAKTDQAGTYAGFSREELRPLSILKGLPDEQLDWFAEHGERIVLGAGDHMFERGEPAESMWLVVTGAIQGFEEIAGQWLLVATTERGRVTGMLPFSRMTHYPRYTVAPVPSEVLRLGTSLFDEMQAVSVEVVRRLVAQMSDRVRGDVRLEQQNEKMIAIGRLSAGLAHELNNPAAAMQRAVARLAEYRTRMPKLVTSLVRHHVSDEALRRLERLRRAARRRQATSLTPLGRSDREDELAAWLEARLIGESWLLAATFVDAGMTVQDLSALDTELRVGAREGTLSCALSWLSAGLESDQLVEEIGAAAQHISELVESVKSYSHMDRSPEHRPTDVRAGLDSTIAMLRHRLEERAIRLSREYQSDLPSIAANGGQLNQVWTILVDNAIDAMDVGGELILRATQNDRWVEVDVIDDGPGIPADIRSRVFEPFFTTKEVGAGTGLSLGIAKRCVETHQGHIQVRSNPGRTELCVRLPARLERERVPNGMNEPVADLP